ncbi:acetyl-CoA carboxylase carboxyltransferase subunit alpha [candidate division KSB1 bacterium]|nr:acetyl-CoA carboxylase carboxyltransferase subunit alpha [candidate division KSB1 bacterium]
MSGFILDFEKPIIELEKKILEMKEYSSSEKIEVNDEIKRLEEKVDRLRRDIFSKLTRWQRVQVARHPRRPYALDYIQRIFTNFIECHGDRAFADDPAIVAGIAKLDGESVVIVSQQKGRDTKQKLFRNFAMPHPEGYRKALRLMKLAEKFNKPIISIVDTPGAYPGIGAEERGQAEAIARNLLEMSHLRVPIIIAIIGEGASGGALGIGVGDRVLMQENTWYSVISPEGCAAILWRDSSKADLAADEMKLAPNDLIKLGVIDEIVLEPSGGAHRDYDEAARLLKAAILRHLEQLQALSKDELVHQRIDKYSKMGKWIE